jgi:hypothetical protein
LISASLRKRLLLRYGSVIQVEIDGKSFSTKVDERGRFGVPKGVRGDSSEVEGVISVFSFSSNGRYGVMSTCEPVELESRVKFPVPAPFSKKIERRRFE